MPVLPESKKTPFYPALDGLRAIAVAMVFVVHFVYKIMPWGWLGVQVFFVLSGFLITGILYDTIGARGNLRNFYGRRVLRIFPLYYAFLALCGLVLLVTHGPCPRSYALWLVYLQNFFWLVKQPQTRDVLYTGAMFPFAAIGHLWSLALEEQFYLVWPILVFAIRDRRRLMQTCCGLILFRLGLAVFWQLHLSPSALETGIIYRMLPTQADALLIGALLSLWLRGRPSAKLQLHSGRLALFAISFYAALLAVLHVWPNLISGQDVFDYTSGFQTILGLPLSNVVSAAVLLAVLQPGTSLFHLCQLAPMRSLGRISYGLYVYHLPIYVLCAGFVQRLCSRHVSSRLEHLLHATFATLLTIAVSYASFHLFEKRFLLLKNRFVTSA